MRVLIDAVADCTHFGHINCFRQGRGFGDKIVAGIHSDEEVCKHKFFSPVFKEHERYELVRAIRYVDEVIEGIPYDYTLATLEQHHIDLNCHGDEATFSFRNNNEAVELYKDIKDAGKYRTFPRTQGTCTTDVIDAILELNSRQSINYCRNSNTNSNDRPMFKLTNGPVMFNNFEDALAVYYEFLTSGREPTGPRPQSPLGCDPTGPRPQSPLGCEPTGPRPQIQIRSEKIRATKFADEFVYVQGDFDIFTLGHLRFLQRAAKEGTGLIVGINSDAGVRRRKGITEEFLDEINASVVCQSYEKANLSDFEIPKRIDRLRLIDSGSYIRSSTIVERILSRRDEYEIRNAKKRGQSVPNFIGLSPAAAV